MPWWFTLALLAISFIGLILLAPKPQLENAKPASFNDLKFPHIEQGRPIPIISGRVKHEAPNVVWYGDFEAVPIRKKVKTGLFSSKHIIVGYRYFIGFHVILCLGPGVKLHKVYIDKKSQVVDLTTAGSTATLDIDLENERGKFEGTIRWYPGDFTQAQNAYLAATVDTNYTTHPGFAHLVFEKVEIGKSPNLPKIAFELSKYTTTLGAVTPQIGDDVNPIETLYHFATNEWEGAGRDPNEFDTTNWRDVAATVAAENNGYSILIQRDITGKEILEEILSQIDGVIFQDPSTALMKLKLIRDDYVIASLPTFDENNIEDIKDYNKTSWSSTVNIVRVSYTSRARDYKTATTPEHDEALMDARGARVPAVFSFPGATTASLAKQLAARERARATVPSFTVKFNVNREAWTLNPGDPFIFSWDRFEIIQAVMRVDKISLGKKDESVLEIDSIVDQFAFDKVVFGDDPNTGWTPVDRTLNSITVFDLEEAPYWFVEQTIGPPVDGTALMLASPRRPTNGVGYFPYSALVNDDEEMEYGAGEDPDSPVDYPISAQVNTAYDVDEGYTTGIDTTTGLVIKNLDGTLTAKTVAQIRAGELLVINATTGEIFGYESISGTGPTWTLNNVHRALLDTEFLSMAVDQYLFFITPDQVLISEYDDADTVFAKLLNTIGGLDEQIEDVTATSKVMAGRLLKPLPPDDTQIAASRNPPTITVQGIQTITWKERTRLSGQVTLFQDTTETPETSQQYTVELWVGGVLQGGFTQTGVTGTSTTMDINQSFNNTAEIRIQTNRGSENSLTKGVVKFVLNT
jgi:hypothetical protein